METATETKELTVDEARRLIKMYAAVRHSPLLRERFLYLLSERGIS